MECYIDLCPWKGKTSVRWSRIDKKINRQNDQKLTSTASRHPNQTDPPPKQKWVPPTFENKRRQSTKWDKDPTIAHRMAVDDGRPSKGRKWTDYGIFFDGHPKLLPKNHYPHCQLHRMPNGYSERIERKHGQKVTKMKKGGARHSPSDALSQATGPDSFLYEYSMHIDTRTTDTSVIAIRL